MSGFKSFVRRFSIRAAIVLFISFFLCFSAFTFGSFLRPHIKSNYVLAANDESQPYLYKTKGIVEYFGGAVDFVFGGNFTDIATIAGVVSGNLTYDNEKVSYIEDMPLASQEQESEILEKTVSSGDGKINNETSYTISANDLNSTPAFKLSGKKSDPQVLIFHSHATESYAPTKKFSFPHTSEDRTTDSDYNMVRIGKELKGNLEKKGIKCVHITDLFDYPEYNNSYARSAKKVLEVLKNNPSIKIVLDLHRDSIINSEGVKTKLTTVIDGEKVAQVMLVVGTDELGLTHDNWRTNLKFATHFQKFLLSENENFARPINLRTSRFNGHTAPGAVIVEVGTGGNTIEEALATTKYIASALENLIKAYA